MKDLQKYYGKELVYVLTELKKGKIETSTQIKRVYDPRDFSRRVRPCDGCDLVIGDNSANSIDIFEIGGIHCNNNAFSFGHFDSITLFNYCEAEQVNQVIDAHKEAIKKALNTFIGEQQKRVNDTIEILKTL